MTTQLIKTQDKFILVSDEKAKEGDIGYIPFEGGSIKTIGKYFADDWVKVISENPDFSLLSEEDCKTIGWVDVEKLAKLHKVNISSTWSKDSFIEGFKTRQSLNDKMFSLEDMRFNLILAQKTVLVDLRSDEREHEFTVDEIIQSLQQTSWDVEVNELNQITKIL